MTGSTNSNKQRKKQPLGSRPLTEEEQKLVSRVIYTLLHGKDYQDQGDIGYALFLHHMDIRAEDTPRIPAPASIGVIADGTMVMRLCFPALKKLGLLDINPFREVLKHETLHFIQGHVGSRGRKLADKYGIEIEGIAADLVVNQFIDAPAIITSAFKPLLIKDFNFPPNLTTEAYCKLILGRIEEVKNKIEMKLVNDGNGEYKLEVILENESDSGNEVSDVIKDAAIVNVVKQVTDELKESVARGFKSLDAEEYVKALEQPSKIPWYVHLRKYEGKYARKDIVPSKRRPSRRCPQHFGRIRKHGLVALFVIDTSMSMSKQELQYVEPEVKGLAERGTFVHVMHVDAGVTKIVEYKRYMKIEKFSGRGGTDFRPAFKKIPELYPPPDFVVYFTDGAGIAPVEQPIPTLWVLTSTGMSTHLFRDTICSWGEITTLDVNHDEIISSGTAIDFTPLS